LAQYRHVDQWNTIEDPQIKPHSYSHPIFDKAPKIYVGEKTTTSSSGVEKTGYSHVED
jgi:hypothetical protein